MANQQEQKLAQDLIKIGKAMQPQRRVENGMAVTDYGNGQTISLPMYGSSVTRSLSVSSK